MKDLYYSTIVNQLRERSVEATLGVLGLESEALREYLRDQLSNDPNQSANILSDPVFESVFPWTQSDKTLEKLSTDLLHPALVDAMDKPKLFKEHTFSRKSSPYTHQLRSWRILMENKPKSLIVTSGTGSGKTECFMIPILNDLVKEQMATKQKLEGVQALFIYPLNALINSQRERLSAWTSPFESKIRFCLYNGNTEEKVKANIQSQSPSEVMSREALRSSPPPILITNPTMLEYMLIRTVDRPIIEKSKGKLKYIVLDEAHSYIGSQAAELSLLLRRALHAFGAKASEIRFIATSATIGSDESSKDALKKYLADLAGISADNIEVIEGTRSVPSLPDTSPSSLEPDQILRISNAEEKYQAVVSNTTARRLRNELIGRPRTLTELAKKLYSNNNDIDFRKTLEWLDICSNPQFPEFLPIRGHLFHRVINGLWACVSPSCTAKHGTALKADWKFGKVYTYQRVKCDCGAPIFEIVICNECNTVHLSAYVEGNKLVPSNKEVIDEFSLEADDSMDEDDLDSVITPAKRNVIIAPKEGHGTFLFQLDGNGNLDGGAGDGIPLHYNDSDLACSSCSFGGFGNKPAFRHAYLGTPFYVSNIIPTLLEHCPDGKDDPSNRPMYGRSLITFTDSRQGSARIAAKIQQDSERNRTRGLVFEQVSRTDNSANIVEKKGQIDSLKNLKSNDPNILKMIRDLEIKLKENEKESIAWNDLVYKLQNHIDIETHMLDYYKNINSEIFRDSSILTRILLTREFSRRPKRSNSLETLGLVSVTYSGLEKVIKSPKEWEARGLTHQDWLDFLKICLDFYVRDGIFIDIPAQWLNWLGGRYTPKHLLSPNTPPNQAGSRHKIWPSYDRQRGRRQQRLIRLLAHVLNIDLEIITKEEIDFLNSILISAWVSLTMDSGILQGPINFKLEMDKIQFAPISKAWLCPITLRILDTTLRGFTPYLPIGSALGAHQCKVIATPQIPKFQSQTHWERLDEIRNWIKDDQIVASQRKLGLWTDQSDRIVEGGVFFSVR